MNRSPGPPRLIQDAFSRRPWSQRGSLGLAPEQWGFVNVGVALGLGLDEQVTAERSLAHASRGSGGKSLHPEGGDSAVTGALGGSRGSGGGGQRWRGPLSLSVAVTNVFAFLPSKVMRHRMEAVEKPAAESPAAEKVGTGNEGLPLRDSQARRWLSLCTPACWVPVWRLGPRGQARHPAAVVTFTPVDSRRLCSVYERHALWGRGVHFLEDT